jgi:hypothetical protein
MGVTAIVTRQITAAAVTTAKIASNAITLALQGWATAKGDLVVAQSSTTYANLAVGSDTFVLTADSTQANGIKWAANPALATTNFVNGEVPTGTINGSNTTFTLANTPSVAASVHVFVNGLRQLLGTGNDYTFSSTTITFLTGSIPQTGDILFVDYMK